MHLISFLFTRLFQHHFPESSAEEPDSPAERPTTEPNPIPQFDSLFWDCQLVACNVSWHFHNPRASLKCPSFYSGKVSFLLPVMFSFAAKGIKRYNPVNWRVIDWPWPCASLFLFLPLSQETWFLNYMKSSKGLVDHCLFSHVKGSLQNDFKMTKNQLLFIRSWYWMNEDVLRMQWAPHKME